MAHQKNATPTKAQQEILRAHGLDPHCWVVIRDYNFSMIIKNRSTDEYRVIEKHAKI